MFDQNNGLIELTDETISSMIYEVRGQKVILDFDLAEIYGYSTRDFNKQVKNNIEKFDDDFMFTLTNEEWKSILKWKKSTSSWGGRRKLPHAFNEQGIYMLMTVLKGELATKQSKALIRLFKKMKDYIIESNSLISASGIIELTNIVNDHSSRLDNVEKKLDAVMDNFVDHSTYKHFLILDGKRLEADSVYQKIYSLAKKSVFIIDDYLDLKTLELLKSVAPEVSIRVFSDNKAKNKLNDTFINNFIKETGNEVSLVPTKGRFHDRYVVIDYATENELIFHCGASSKDAGKRVTTITKIEDTFVYRTLFAEMFGE